MELKKCFKCGKEKDLSMFYKHKQMGDGYLGKCKDCTKTDSTDHRNANLGKIRHYDRERGKLPHRLKLNADRNKRLKKIHPEHYIARNKVGNAIRDGRLFRPDRCSSCNKKGKVMGHHHDYEKPLEVIWLCQPCHKQLHRDTF